MMHTCLGGRNFTIDETRFKAGLHRLDITIIESAIVGPRASLIKSYQFNIRRKLILCMPGRGARKALM